MVRVKMTENTNIICQRFSQNAWKKDLCSNCFKSKEDHDLHVHVPPPYRHRPILNFPQQGILKESNGKRTGNQAESKDKSRTRVVSFQTTETEIIGYGGADEYQYSSSDDDNEYCSISSNGFGGGGDDNHTNNYSSVGTGTNNEDELEFRKLTRSNTDFNSITANLTTSDDQNSKTTTSVVRKPYIDLKLGKPLVDGQGCKRTLQVTIEPFTSGARLASPKTAVAKSELDSGKTAAVNTDNVKIDQPETQNGDLSTTDGCRRSNSPPTLKSPAPDNIVVAAADECTKITNSTIVVQSSPSKTDDLATHRLECEARIDSLLRPVGSATKDSNPICLPLIACKALDIEFDQPGSRELVGEPDGKADSDDSYELLQAPLPSLVDRTNAASIVGVDNGDARITGLKTTIVATVTTTAATTITTAATIDNSEATTKISPQRSFLHDFGTVNTDVERNSKEDIASTLSSSSSVESLSTTQQSTIASVSTFTAQTTPSTPRTTKLSANCTSGPGGSSTKRPAPKPPSPKIITPSTAFAFAQNRRHNRSRITAETDYCESPLMSGTRDAISFLTGTTRMATDTKRRASLYEYFDSPISCPPSSNRNSLNFCSLTPDTSVGRLCTLRRYSTALNDSRGFDADTERRWPSYSATDTASMCSGTVRIRKYDSPAKKCVRSLSYDSIPSPSAAFALSPKSTAIASKYSVATIKVKSTLRRFLRFNINNTGSTRITNDAHERRRSSRSDLSAIAKAFSASSSSSSTPTKAEPRQRPVIIHPLDLNKSPVQIVTMGTVNASRNSSEKTENKTVDKTKHLSTVPSSNSSGVIYATPISRPTKPPPPPRTQSLDHCKYSSPCATSCDNGTGSDKATGTGSINTTKPTRPPRPPPPKTPTKDTPDLHPTHSNSPLHPEIYVNITPKVNS